MLGNLKYATHSQFNVLKEFRLLNRLKCRIEKLELQKEMQKKYRKNADYSILDKEVQMLKKWLSRLDNNSFICNKQEYINIYQKYKGLPQTIEEHTILLTGQYIQNKDRSEEKLNKLRKEVEEKPTILNQLKLDHEEFIFEMLQRTKNRMRKQCLESRKREKLFRLYMEILNRKKDWYIVFNTLTVAPENIKKVFNQGATGWTDYVRRVDREIGIRVSGNWRDAIKDRSQGKEFHRYFAVVEKGEKTGQLHIHVIHLMKKLPYGSYDPNRGAGIPKNREISIMKKYWQLGYSMPIAVRFNTNDSYGKLGWRYPYEEKEDGDFKPLKCTNEIALVQYIGKYMTKNLNQRKVGVTTWRTRLSRKLGTEIVQELMETMNEKQLTILMNYRTDKKMIMFGKMLPTNLVKIMATKEYLKKKKAEMPEQLWLTMLELQPQKNMWKHIKDTIQARAGFSLPNCGSTMMLNLLKTEGSRLFEKLKNIETKYGYIYCKIDGVSGTGVQI